MAPDTDLKATRIDNLKALRLSASELVVRYGKSYSYWQGLLNGSRSFGEKAAREIEDIAGLPRNHLDQVDGEGGLFRDLDAFEAQFITLLRKLGPQARNDVLTDLNLRVSPTPPTDDFGPGTVRLPSKSPKKGSGQGMTRDQKRRQAAKTKRSK